jgi:arylsulfatase A-like enzyme
VTFLRPAALAFLLLGACAAPPQARPERRPNVVFILTDNQGAWTLGCYGNRDIRTPAIDRLASEGVRFTRCFSSNAVCSPTRATFLTGLLPSQHGIHCYLNGDEFQVGADARCLIREFRTLPKILVENGYACGLAGKWHLGGNLTPQEGFSSWITMPAGHTTTFTNAEVIEEGKVRKEPQYLTDLWTDRAVRFIQGNRTRPFFLYLAYNGPYGLGGSLLEPDRNRHAAYYADKELASFPRGPMKP